MSGSGHQHREKHGKGSEISKDYYREGTAARTRPLSFNEIMLKRKNKKELFNNEKEEVVEDFPGVGSTERVVERGNRRSKDGNMENVSEKDDRRSEDWNTERVLGRGDRRSKDGNSEKVPEIVKGRSKDGNREKILERGDRHNEDGNMEKVSERDGRRSKDWNMERVSGGGSGRNRDGNAEKVSERGNKRNKDGNTEKVSERGNERNKDGNAEKVSERNSGRSKDGNTEKVSERGAGRTKDSSSGIQKHFSERDAKLSSKLKEQSISMKNNYSIKSKDREIQDSETKVKAKMDRELKDKAKIEEKVSERRISDKQRNNHTKNEASKKHVRHLTERDRHVDGSRGNPKRENKRKYRNEVDEKDRDRYPAEKHDLGQVHNSETLDRKERKELSKSSHEETKMKRRRSRSREHVDRKRRSISPLPRSQKPAFCHGREHGELSSHSLRGKYGEQDSDIDKRKIANNGSSSHSKRHGGSTSGLGGYSPRKRRSGAAVRTPSPTKHSPEKKRAKWDLVPKGADNTSSASVIPVFQLSNQTAYSNSHVTVSAVPVAPVIAKPFPGVSSSILSTYKNYSIDSVQLTQATRPRRRLYIENLPAAASEKALMEWLNNLLISSCVNHILGSQPCISCTIHKGKGQALVEFLTPEDASAALSFDGTSFSGSTIKIRRPKDYVEMATGELEKSVAAVDAINSVVKDSPQKIFIGGISKILSSKMIMEIASSFGPLQAFAFESSDDLNGSCAFVEYADQSVASKACAGLNGMKLGGQVISVVQIAPNASTLESNGKPPFYGIPEQAKPLLDKPMQVLRLKNVFDPETFPSLSHTEIEEVLEDVRLECARFGTVKSVNVVKYGSATISTAEPCKVDKDMEYAGSQDNLGCDDSNVQAELTTKSWDHKPAEADGIGDDKPADDIVDNESCQLGQNDNNVAIGSLSGRSLPESQEPILQKSKDESDCTLGKVIDNVEMKDASAEDNLHFEEELNLEEVGGKFEEVFVDNHVIGSETFGEGEHKEQNCEEELNLKEVCGKLKEEFTDDNGVGSDAIGKVEHKIENWEEELNLKEVRGKLKEEFSNDHVVGSDAIGEVDYKEQNCEENLNLVGVCGQSKEVTNDQVVGSDAIGNRDQREQNGNLGRIFEPGCVFVEFGRTEASCMAAHCLHGRLFDNRTVTVGYIPLDVYQSRYPR